MDQSINIQIDETLHDPPLESIIDQQQEESNQGHNNSNNSKNLNMSSLMEYLRKLNEYLEQEEEYDRHNRKIRRIIYKHDLVQTKLLQIYKYLLTRLNSEQQKETFTQKAFSLLENHKELIANLKLIKTLNELLKLLVDLTSPSEILFINHNLIFIILNRFELIVKHNQVQMELPDFLDEISQIDSDTVTLNEIIESNIVKFKEELIRIDLFGPMGSSFLNLVEYYTSVSGVFHQHKHQTSHSYLKHFKLLTNILFDSLVLSLALIRNLTFERAEPKLTLIVNCLFDSKLDQFLLNMSNLAKLNKSFADNKKYEQRAFVSYSLLVQIMSLLFSKLSNTLNTQQNRSESPLSSSSSSHQANLSPNDIKTQTKQCKSYLNKLGKSLCKTGLFACILEQMLRLLTKPIDLYVYFDLSYLLWFLKFLISNYVLKQVKDPGETEKSTKNESFNFDYVKNRLSKKTNIEKSFINDFKSEASQKTKKILLNYDLLAYIVFLLLENFEQLIFDSNVKNMNLLRLFHLKELCENEPPPSTSAASIPPAKVVNTNSLRLVCLSINCLYELIDCINHHLEYLDSFKINTLASSSSEHSAESIGSQEDYLIYLNEFSNFDELKQLFPLMMRFYCYNQHVYSNSFIKSIFLTNQLFLNTYKHVHDLIRQIKLREQEKEMYELNSDTNATKNSSTISSLTFKPLNLTEIYNMYANTDTSFILKHVLTQFVHNDPTLNRCVIDLLDTLMCESDKHEYLFHMNFALALANIATLDNYRLLDQRTKDLVSNMLCGIRRLCKRRPNFANKILFDVHNKFNDNIEDDFSGSNSRKRIKLDTSGSDPFFDSDSISKSKYSTTSSSWSSLKSTTTQSPSSSSPTSSNRQEYPVESASNEKCTSEMTKDLKLLIENEFLFCIRSLDVFNKTNYNRQSHKLDPSKLCNFIIKNDHLYRIFNYLVDLFESSMSNDLRLNSWQIYNCLLTMKFSMNDKINYLNELNQCYSTGSKFNLGINLGFGPFKNDFFRSNECISLRQACSTDEFRKQLKEAYIKYLIEKLCIKSKRTKNAIFWVFNMLKRIKLYLTKRSIYLNKNTNDLNQFNLASHQYGLGTMGNAATSAANVTLLLITASSSIFQMKLINYYHVYNLGVPLVPYTFELQQVFHSVDFSHLLDILGIVRTNRGFPFIPPSWLDSNKNKLNECLSVMEKCLCI